MTIQQIGVFSTEDKAIHVANNLELKGYKAANITIFTNNSSPNELNKYTDVNIKSDLPSPKKDHTLMEKIKAIFSDSKDDDQAINNYEMLVQLGFSEEEATKWITELEAGNVLVVADDDIRMGHPSPINIKQ
ncbi:general stress protein [Virgibacillus sp. W0430]|uniref:general stress protein n=1 Tax=Virgibacillus sp. W0430 TaxID=3391580 RepID=UPI003F454251